ncbi:hypothetical protein EU528_08515 [Candidatus Thorarchaeota archaeon]|nr:MAG: hypothetical protein EU528_08515 [Candidatus Thorarchaeota archaeon]
MPGILNSFPNVFFKDKTRYCNRFVKHIANNFE